MLAYLLSPLRHLTGVDPSSFDVDAAIEWIRATELPWSPGSVDLAAERWTALMQRDDDGDAVDWLLREAAAEVRTCMAGQSAAAATIEVAARKRLAVTTLEYVLACALPRVDDDLACADVHVHQGAALPVEVTVHWVAKRITSIAEGVRDQRRPLRDSARLPFNPLPLLLVLRAVLDNHPRWSDGLQLARSAATGSGDAWDELAQTIAFSEPSEEIPSPASIRLLKERARHNWTRERLHALFRLEAVMHGAVTQSVPGLDVFVDVFDDLASVRRGQFPKPQYFARSIDAHVSRTSSLRALELRLGEPVFDANAPQPEAIAREYHSALSGYRSFAGDNDAPLTVTFPFGFIKTAVDPSAGSSHWRLNPWGIYTAVESLITVLENCPALAPFIDGLDVSGRELDAPNWLFAPAYKRFATWSTHNGHVPTLRFHAGEWVWSPLHGLRRIAEFARFPLPEGTRQRIGHALSLHSADWTQLPSQPLDELLDDLLWALDRLASSGAGGGPAPMALERTIRDVLTHFPDLGAASTDDLIHAYLLRVDDDALARIGFLQTDGEGRLSFPDYEPVVGGAHRDALLGKMLRKRAAVPPCVGEATFKVGRERWSMLDSVTPLLVELYEELSADLVTELRWQGIVVESCPTSNIVVGGIRGFANHPAARLIEQGLQVAVGSDDPSLFHSWAGDEHRIAEEFLGLHRRDVPRSRQLGVRLVGAGLKHGSVRARLSDALAQLEEHYSIFS